MWHGGFTWLADTLRAGSVRCPHVPGPCVTLIRARRTVRPGTGRPCGLQPCLSPSSRVEVTACTCTGTRSRPRVVQIGPTQRHCTAFLSPGAELALESVSFVTHFWQRDGSALWRPCVSCLHPLPRGPYFLASGHLFRLLHLLQVPLSLLYQQPPHGLQTTSSGLPSLAGLSAPEGRAWA